MRPSGDQPDVPCGPRGEMFAHHWTLAPWMCSIHLAVSAALTVLGGKGVMGVVVLLARQHIALHKHEARIISTTTPYNCP